MSKTLKDCHVSTIEINDNQKQDKDRPARSLFKNNFRQLTPEDWEDLELEIFEKM